MLHYAKFSKVIWEVTAKTRAGTVPVWRLKYLAVSWSLNHLCWDFFGSTYASCTMEDAGWDPCIIVASGTLAAPVHMVKVSFLQNYLDCCQQL